ncbi:MAG: hypothetical protein NVSMB22_16580 [Chloroflexota bacterium]
MSGETKKGPGMTAIVPSIVGWHTYRRAFVTLVFFGLVALAGEWLVHQLEYLIEYRAAFSSVMALTPHRYYTAPFGILAAAAMLASLLALRRELRAAYRRRALLLAGLSERVARRAPVVSHASANRLPYGTWVVLAALQIVLYLFQENVEGVVVSHALPGLWVMLAPQHVTVIPLHVLVAACAAFLLRATADHIHGARQALHMARVLARIAAAPVTQTPRPANVWLHRPSLQPTAGVLGLRSPPLA